METGNLPTDLIKASTVFKDKAETFGPRFGRLNTPNNCWVPHNSDPNPWIQVRAFRLLVAIKKIGASLVFWWCENPFSHDAWQNACGLRDCVNAFLVFGTAILSNNFPGQKYLLLQPLSYRKKVLIALLCTR